VQFVPLSHSIPECAALIIDTPAGRVIHTGDFKIDRAPVVGEGLGRCALESVAREAPVKALMCDSTNVFSPHPGRSESLLAEPLTELISEAPQHVRGDDLRLERRAAEDAGRGGGGGGSHDLRPGPVDEADAAAAQETGVLTSFPQLVTPEEALEMPRRNLMLLVTGSQGERRAARPR
jgi:ribonuclease J